MSRNPNDLQEVGAALNDIRKVEDNKSSEKVGLGLWKCRPSIWNLINVNH